MISWIETITYIGCFGFSFYALSAIRFDQLCYVKDVNKVRLLLFLLAMGLGYLVAQFLLMITIYH